MASVEGNGDVPFSFPDLIPDGLGSFGAKLVAVILVLAGSNAFLFSTPNCGSGQVLPVVERLATQMIAGPCRRRTKRGCPVRVYSLPGSDFRWIRVWRQFRGFVSWS